MFRIVGGLPHYNTHHKNVEFRQLTNNLEVNVLGYVETNLNWQKIPTEHRLGECMLTCWEHHHLVVAQNNNDETNSKQQWGGLSIISINQVANRSFEIKKDPTKLGKWAWTRYKGQNSIVTL